MRSSVDSVAEVASLGRDVERKYALLTDMANMRDEAVERVENLGAQLAASAHREAAYKLGLTVMKEDLVKSRVEHANLR